MAYSSLVERWRSLVQQYFKPEDVDKALYVISGESGGNPNIYGDGGHSVGLFQHNDGGLASGRSLTALKDPESNIRLAAEAVYGGQGWGPWGEGRLYKGKPFGHLGRHPYGGVTPPTTGNAGMIPPTQAQTSSNDAPSFSQQDFQKIVGYDDSGAPIYQNDVGSYLDALNKWQAYRRWERDDSSQYYEALINEIGAKIDAGQLKLSQGTAEFDRRMTALKEGNRQFEALIGYAIPQGATHIPNSDFYAGMGLTPTPATPINIDPYAMAMDIVNQTPNLAEGGVPDVSNISSMLAPGMGISSGNDAFSEALGGGGNKVAATQGSSKLGGFGGIFSSAFNKVQGLGSTAHNQSDQALLDFYNQLPQFARADAIRENPRLAQLVGGQ